MQHEGSQQCPPRRVHPQLPARVTRCVHLPGLQLRPQCTCRVTCTAVTQASKRGATDQEVASIMRDVNTQVSGSICWLQCHITAAHCPVCVATC